MAKTSYIPTGYHTVTPYITVNDAAEAIEFYKRAFGAEERFRMPGPGGKIMHSEIQIGDSMVMLSDEFPGFGMKSPVNAGCSTASIMIYIPDVDASFDRAVKAGAKTLKAVENTFWGDRYGHLIDPFGHHWSLATHIEDVSMDEMERRSKEFMAQMQAAS